MNLDRSLERAQGAKTMKQAAEVYHGIEYELALGNPSDEQESQAEQALSHLREQFPGVQEQAYEVQEPPPLSRKAGENLRSGDNPRPALEARTRERHRAERRIPNKSLRQRVGHATAVHARPRRSRSHASRSGPAGRARQASSSVGQLIIRGVEGIVALTLLGLLVGPRGSSAFSGLGNELVKFLDALANPSDTLFTAKGAGGGGHEIPFVATAPKKRPPGSSGPKYGLHRIPVLPPAPVRGPSPSPGSPFADPLVDPAVG